MLYFLGQHLQEVFGPFRLLQSHIFLIGAGLYSSFMLSWWLLPKLTKYLPPDRGRKFAAGGCASRGKPTGAGMVFVSIFVLVSLLVVPFGLQQLLILAVTLCVMLSGYLDDKSPKPWSEYRKGLVDLFLAVTASLVLSMGDEIQIWLPFTKSVFFIHPVVFILLSSVLIWVSINTTNCSDGVDGLSGTLVLLALVTIGGFLYLVVGHKAVASYFLLPHYSAGAAWAVMAFTLAGAVGGYLWHNASPSTVLMGDAGSRAIGFFIGVSVINSGNPFLILIFCSVLLVNGGVGLVKVASLRFFRIRIFGNIRFPLHDHVRSVKKWSNTQIIIRFALIQMLVTILLLGILIKVR